jgi:multiple sugar transport system substrate-binding protein
MRSHRTASFPNKPDGSPIKYRSDVKTGVIFAAAKNKAGPRSSWRS